MMSGFSLEGHDRRKRIKEKQSFLNLKLVISSFLRGLNTGGKKLPRKLLKRNRSSTSRN